MFRDYENANPGLIPSLGASSSNTINPSKATGAGYTNGTSGKGVNFMMTEYLNTIYQYYPKDIYPSDIKCSYTPEITNQWELIDVKRRDNRNFEEMISAIVELLNCDGYQDMSLQGVFDLSYKAVLFLPVNHFTVDYPCCIINVSVIAEYYSIYFSKFTGIPINTLRSGPINNVQVKFENIISAFVKNYYQGYQIFPIEALNEEVPRVFSSIKFNQYATYFECLVTNNLL